jgi:hypothetical protein
MNDNLAQVLERVVCELGKIYLSVLIINNA